MELPEDHHKYRSQTSVNATMSNKREILHEIEKFSSHKIAKLRMIMTHLLREGIFE